MSKGEQIYFEGMRRKFHPAASRIEPMIWFREVRILDELSADKSFERRRVTLHRGLNILWAAPEDPDTEQGLYRDGLAGHASGKTLFCRLLRHLLGEEPFGTKAQRESIAGNFVKLWVVGSLRVSGESWVVGRPLAAAGSDFAIRAETIDEVLASAPPSGGYREYMEAVARIAQKANELYPGNGWRHLLPWLSRDQEARFGSLAQWREATSEGDNPQTKAIERHQLMRAILGLLDLREPQLRSAIEKAQSDLETGLAKVGRLESELKGKVDLANTGARQVLVRDAPTEAEALASRLDSFIEVLREGLEELESRPEHPAVAAARLKMDAAQQELRDAERQRDQLPTSIAEKENRRDADLLLVRNLKTGNVQDPAREKDGWCPNTIQTAITRQCVCHPAVSTESATNVADLERQAQEADVEIHALKERQRLLVGKIPVLQVASQNVEKAYQAAVKEATKDATALARRAEQAETVKHLFEQVAKAEVNLENERKANARITQQIEQQKKEVGNLRGDLAGRITLFSNDFADIVRAVMGVTVEAEVSVTGEGFVTRVTRKGELSGAALDTIKTVAFDLAAMVASMEGRGDHPRFLIHDGPREGDMARVIYDRFFIYVAELETIFPTRDQASFQYLITTTTPPPKSMQQGSRWLLDPVLDSRKKEQRLLKEDF